MISAILAIALGKISLADHVLVIANDRSPESRAIASYYMAKRGIPSGNLCTVSTETDEETNLREFNKNYLPPLKAALAKPGRQIEYIVTTKGLPIRFTEGKYGVEATIASIDSKLDRMKDLSQGEIDKFTSPYFGKSEHYSRAKFGMYLVTRLDGYTLADAKRLVDNSVNGKPTRSPFLFDNIYALPSSSAWKVMDGYLSDGAKRLRARGLPVILDDKYEFRGGLSPLAGYVSWGSNDPTFDATKYHQLRFEPGAIAETFVSTSARTFAPTVGGQSLIADLIAQGVTGVKGYVYEPYLFAMADPRILFERYTRGYNLAESYYMASRCIKWRDLIIGDPLCSPYAPH